MIESNLSLPHNLAALVLGIFHENERSNHLKMWEANLTFMKCEYVKIYEILMCGLVFGDSWEKISNLDQDVFLLINNFLIHGCYGSAEISYPSLLPWLSFIPKKVNTDLII